MKNRNPILCLGLLLFSSTALSGCSWSSGTGGNEPPEMHKQYSRTIDIQTSIVVGDLDRAKEAATWLATYDGIEGFPPGSDEFWAEIRRYAALISQAEDLGAIAVQVGQIASTCGYCHQATSGGPTFVVGSGPPQGSGQARRMIVHLWATDRMWEGLVGPSDEAWAAGVDALANARKASGGAFLTATSPSDAEDMEAELEEVVGQAIAAQTPEARTAAYGRLLSTCNSCHKQRGTQVEG